MPCTALEKSYQHYLRRRRTPEINRGNRSTTKIPTKLTHTAPCKTGEEESKDGRSPGRGDAHSRHTSQDSFGSFGSFGSQGQGNHGPRSGSAHHRRNASTNSSTSNKLNEGTPGILPSSSNTSSDSGNGTPTTTLSAPYANVKKQSFDSLAGYSVTSGSSQGGTPVSASGRKTISPLKPPTHQSRASSNDSSHGSSNGSTTQRSLQGGQGGQNSHATPLMSHSHTRRSRGPPRNPSVDMMNRRIHDQAKRHLRLGELDAALEKFEEILESQRKQYGTTHKLVGAALHNVAICHVRAKRLTRALTVCQEAVQVRQQALGPQHSDVAQSLAKLGTIHTALHHYDQAMQAFGEALRIRRHLYTLHVFGTHGTSPNTSTNTTGENGDTVRATMIISPQQSQCALAVAQMLSHVGLLYFQLEEMLAAVTTFEEVLLIYRNDCGCLGENSNNNANSNNAANNNINANLAETLVNIGTIRSKRQQFDKAIVALEEAMMLQTLEFGEDHMMVLTTMDSLAYSYSKYKSHDNAVDLYQQMLVKQERKVVKHTTANPKNKTKSQFFELECIKTLGKLSIVHEKMQHLSQALNYTSLQLQRQRQYLDYDHEDLQATKKSFARIEKKIRMGQC
jgi:tetratricopeptide (TPR) repeat protein